jgi:hypothetical protein
LDFRSVVVEEEKREESQRFLLPPIELRSLPEHEAMSKAAALLLLLLRCRPAERREASMALREGKFEKIVRELKEEVCHSFSTRFALGERNTKPKKKKEKNRPRRSSFARCHSRRARLLRGLVSSLFLSHQRYRKTRP